MALHRSSILGPGHGIWNYPTQSNNPEEILKQFLAVGTCFMFVEPFTTGTALSLMDFCILYHKSYPPQENQKRSL